MIMTDGIPYFPLDVCPDDRLDLIEAEFGLKGFAVIVKLYQKIFGGLGYYCEWTNDVGMRFSRIVCEGYTLVSEIVSAAIRRGIFDKDLYEKYNVLTSVEIQEKYFKAVSRRKQVNVKAEYLLIKVDQLSGNVNILSGNVCRNEENVYISEQRKVKESKVKESKVEERREKETARPRGTYSHVILTDKQYENLTSEFGDKAVDDYIRRVDEYCESSGKVYSNYAVTVSRWIKADRDKEKKMRRSRFNNYEPENQTDWDALDEAILDSMLDE